MEAGLDVRAPEAGRAACLPELREAERRETIAGAGAQPRFKGDASHLPLDTLQPGYYTCQVNVIDELGAKVAFPRFPILIKTPANQ